MTHTYNLRSCKVATNLADTLVDTNKMNKEQHITYITSLLPPNGVSLPHDKLLHLFTVSADFCCKYPRHSRFASTAIDKMEAADSILTDENLKEKIRQQMLRIVEARALRIAEARAIRHAEAIKIRFDRASVVQPVVEPAVVQETNIEKEEEFLIGQIRVLQARLDALKRD